MIVAHYEQRDEAEGLRELLRDVGAVEAATFGPGAPDAPRWYVEVLAPLELRALVIHYLYYIKGVAIEQVLDLPREARVDVLVQAMARLALETKQWRALECPWYATRAQLSDADVADALRAAEAEYETHRGGLLRSLFKRR